MSQVHQIRFPASVCPSVRPSVRFKLHLKHGRTDSPSVVRLLDRGWHLLFSQFPG